MHHYKDISKSQNYTYVICMYVHVFCPGLKGIEHLRSLFSLYTHTHKYSSEDLERIVKAEMGGIL